MLRISLQTRWAALYGLDYPFLWEERGPPPVEEMLQGLIDCEAPVGTAYWLEKIVEMARSRRVERRSDSVGSPEAIISAAQQLMRTAEGDTSIQVCALIEYCKHNQCSIDHPHSSAFTSFLRSAQIQLGSLLSLIAPWPSKLSGPSSLSTDLDEPVDASVQLDRLLELPWSSIIQSLLENLSRGDAHSVEKSLESLVALLRFSESAASVALKLLDEQTLDSVDSALLTGLMGELRNFDSAKARPACDFSTRLYNLDDDEDDSCHEGQDIDISDDALRMGWHPTAYKYQANPQSPKNAWERWMCELAWLAMDTLLVWRWMHGLCFALDFANTLNELD